MKRLRFKGRLKICHFFLTFCKFQMKFYFLASAFAIIIILDLTIDLRFTVVKKSVFQSMQIIIFQDKQYVHRS